MNKLEGESKLVVNEMAWGKLDAAGRARMIMKDIKNPKLIYFKAGLFLLIGVASAVLLWTETPTWWAVLLLALTVWGFCRAYYFAFYVIERYVDPTYRFSGLMSFVRYLLRTKADD